MKNKTLKFKPVCKCGGRVSCHLNRKSWDDRDWYLFMCNECGIIGDSRLTFGWAYRAFKNKGKDNV